MINAKSLMFSAAAFAEATGFLLVVAALVPGALDGVMGLLFGTTQGPPLTEAARLGGGVSGALLAAWSATIALLARDVERLDSARFGRAVSLGLLTWFVLDCSVSLATGAYVNCLGNVVYLAVLLTPAVLLWRGWRAPATAGARHA